MKPPRRLSSLVAAAGLAAVTAGAAQDFTSETRWSFTLRAENDLPANSDGYYSSGVSAAFSRCIVDSDATWPGALRVPGLERPGMLGFGFDIGQVMVTPVDTQRSVPDPADRPYAGLLFVGMSWQRLGHDRYAALKLITGVVGPPALAKQTQEAVHRLIHSPQPQGWAHQLRTEPILNAVYERRWRAATRGAHDAWGGDAILIGGTMLGNVLTQAYAHAQFRFGWRVPHDFGTSLIRGIGTLPPARDAAAWGAHVFASVGGLGVARNVTLDGSTFHDGPRVDRRPWVPSTEVGLVWRGHAWQVTGSWVWWGREFAGQPRHSEFGTVALTLFR